MITKKNNSFDEMRFILAFIVLVYHTSVLASTEQLSWFTRYFNSDFAVKGFFAISGYLVTKSYLSSESFTQYLEKRIRRIYPAYVLAIIYCVLIGFLTTNLNIFDFFSNLMLFKYLVANLSFLNFFQPTLPGSIIANEVQALNGSLWTIKVELMLYFTVPILCFLYSTIGMKSTFVVTFAIGIAWFVYFSEIFFHPMGKIISYQFPGQLPFFALGSILGFFTLGRPKVVIGIALVTIIYFFNRGAIEAPYLQIVQMFIYPLIVVLLAESEKLSIGLGRFGDLSYGVYLFHFPTIQVFEHFALYTINPYLGFSLSIVVTLGLAFFSWHVVEKRCLKRSSHYIMVEKRNK